MKLFTVILSLFFFVTSCSSSDDPIPIPVPTPVIVTFNAILNGDAEVPKTITTAKGTATLLYNKTNKTFSLSVTYSGVTATDAHIHSGAIGIDGGIVFPLTGLPSPINFTSPTLTIAQETELLSNLYYVNIHSADFSGGEIRGQLITSNPAGSGGGSGGSGYGKP
jgi:hypothetical protein